MKHFRRYFFLTLIVLAGLLAGAVGAAEPPRTLAVGGQDKSARVAVVIGNSRYPSGALANPRNDATAMAESLKKLGFDVELKLDASKADMDAIFRRFSAKAEKAVVAALFYAGHGIQVGGSNYIVPVDANPKSERDLKRDMVKMDDVIDDMGVARVKLVFFDACRDNPLARSFSRGGSRGMAAPVEATGTLISFATKHGNTAADGEGRHSPYTTALLDALESPGGVEIEQMLRRVQQGVKQATNGQQEPWRYGSLDGDFYFVAATPSADAAKVQQEVVDKAVSEAMRRANEQAARDKAELQQSIKALQEASDRAVAAQKQASETAVAEAVKRSNEQAARERAELQKSMEKMLKEALARQNAAMEAERLALQGAVGGAGKAPAAAQAATQTQAPAAATAEKPLQLAAVAPTLSGAAKPAAQSASISGSAGDEWEYVSTDAYGKKQKMIERVKAIVPGAGLLEEFVVDGRPLAEWVFDGKPYLVGIPTDAVLLFSPAWSGDSLDSLVIMNPSRCVIIQYVTGCGVSHKKIVGKETIKVPAGSYDTTKIEVEATFNTDYGAAMITMVVWYSLEHKRVIRQTIKGRHPVNEASINTLYEVIELAAYRSWAR